MPNPRLVYLIICDSVNFVKNQGPDEKMMIIEPLIGYVPPFLPTQHSFSIAGAINNLEAEKSYSFKVETTNPIGELLSKQEGNIKSGKIENLPSNSSFVIDLRNIPLVNEGEYTVKVYLDDEVIGTQTFSVYKRG
ncbi:hypothetical protein LC085_07705 [Bacillus tianshenii]|uniref:DUF6941 family protein n=1 Tax=Sutcliffiella tianshenii TaxID=1463404 RepID=UPI001CD34D75|nr:hypothetical protein [Bacillus tianshenii]MCA1319797.1 hypothetical protein [Bacillus tianshenii]